MKSKVVNLFSGNLIRHALLFILTLVALTAYSQVTVISSGNDKVVYSGFSTPVYVVSDKYPCKSISVITDNGKIDPSGDCEYLWAPKVPGRGTVKAYKITGKDSVVLGSKRYDVTELKYVFRLYSADNGKLSLEQLIRLKGPMVVPDFKGHLYGVDLSVKGYSVIASRNNQVLFTIHNPGTDFSSETKALFGTLKPADILTFYNISCNSLDGQLLKLDPVEYILAE